MAKATPQPDTFSARDLRLRGGKLFRQAEAGRLSVLTKHGRPAAVAVPVDDWLLRHGVHRALALHLFEIGGASLGTASKIAGLSQEAFLELLAQAGIPAVDYDSDDLERELASAR